MQRTYRYDQLQRLKLTGNAGIDNTALAVASPSDIYKSSYAYDPDGNLTTLQRRDGSSAQIDNFTYHYDASGNNNRMNSVSDAITSSPSAYTDLKSGQPADNYQDRKSVV